MVRMKYIILTLVILMCGPIKFVVAADLPDSIIQGMTVYQDLGAEAAIKAWLSGSPMEGDKDALAQADILKQIEGFYGKFTGYESIKEVDITSTSRLQYIQINYEKGPLFTYFLTYKKGEEWVIVNFKFHTEPGTIFPAEVVFKK